MPTVLIVDDCEALRSVAGCMLTSLGITPAYAEDGQQALDMCADEMPDAVLLDWYMPVMDGPAFHTRLRKMPGGDHAKVIFCTIEDQFEKIADVVSAGADAFIIKPFNLTTLSYHLERLMFFE